MIISIRKGFSKREKDFVMAKIVWIGFHEEGLKAFLEVLKQGYQVIGFITLTEEAFSKRSAGSRKYKQICKKYDVPYYLVETIKSDKAYHIIEELAPDLLVVLGWSEILPERLLLVPSIGTVGTHAALLPHNRGSAPINWALIHGEKTTGNTMMWLTPQVDAGEIIDQVAFEITPYDTCKTLYDRVSDTNAEMLLKLLNNLREGIASECKIENKLDEPILPRRRPKDGLINWYLSGEEIYNFIRALTDPYPGAFTFLNGEKWFIWKAALLPVSSTAIPGTIIGRSYGFSSNSCGYLIATGGKIILVTEMESNKRYTGKSLNELNLKGQLRDE